MGFPSPANDYIEQRLNLNNILMPNPANMIRVDTPEGFVLVDRSLAAKPGDTVAFQFDDHPQIGKLFSSGVITQDGETIDGEGLEGIVVLGKVTAEVLTVYEPYRPII
ncbi:phage repressor protein [Pantoea sp. CFSAN033090]|uniref:phage repressor protein n=1 Tax=Pantoea sp. CFSAN033090 TaxID=1690502 RepID=UPI00068B68AD|nr:phage repressor protein [Pantoea sp. CFSAN033090]KOA70442.1 phage repressor protein [Pantoea sp. CFSAN033090]